MLGEHAAAAARFREGLTLAFDTDDKEDLAWCLEGLAAVAAQERNGERASVLLGAAGQVVKLCADAGVQGEVGDEVRGRVFALYDAVFNVCYVLAVGVAALLAPPTGVAPWLVAATAGVYVLGLLAHDRVLRRASRM